MTNIVSIATAVPSYQHQQESILQFMQNMYGLDAEGKRKLAFLYHQSHIRTRYSCVADYGAPKADWTFIPPTEDIDFPSIDVRMQRYQAAALPLSVNAITQCIEGIITPQDITHLITVSCTGMSAPGLDLQVAEAMQLSPNIFRTSVNFMGCYAAIHGLKLAKMICDSTTTKANVVVVCTELCTLHFQKAFTPDNAASSLLFADGSAAVLLSNTITTDKHLTLQNFYSQIAYQGKKDMAWEISSNGFLMTLSGYIPQLIEQDIETLLHNALQQNHLKKDNITHWCVHPGGRKIVDVIEQKLQLAASDLQYSRQVLRDYGNMSSPTILFVLKAMMDEPIATGATIFGVAFGPGLTMETFIATKS
ncbi:type III polyketide synthase [Parasediminibacterium paludis]|uniref:Type III polyketide synthase n=1 Tax=Parasediminibacterium paludis TaxID=908966 RepID=A0ABV8PTU0_9BACT